MNFINRGVEPSPAESFLIRVQQTLSQGFSFQDGGGRKFRQVYKDAHLVGRRIVIQCRLPLVLVAWDTGPYLFLSWALGELTQLSWKRTLQEEDFGVFVKFLALAGSLHSSPFITSPSDTPSYVRNNGVICENFCRS